MAKQVQQKPAGKSGGNGNGNGGGGNNLMAKKLKQMKERWNQSKEESKKGGSFSVNVEDGKYATALTGATIREGKNDSMGVVFEFTINEGDSTGEKLTRWAGMDTDERVTYLQRDLRRLGVEVDDFDIEQLPQQLEDLVTAAPNVRVTVKTNGDYVNIYIDKLLEETSDDANAGEAQTDTETDAGTDEPTDVTDPEPATETFEPGDEVRYKLKGKRLTGVIKKVNDDETVDIRNDDTKKIDPGIDFSVCEKLAEVAD